MSESVSAGTHDDVVLVPLLQRGDAAAFEQLVRRFGARLLRVARRFLRDEEDARDAVQDAFVAAFRNIEDLQSPAQLSTWLHRVAINASLMRLRARRRRPEEAIEPYLPKFAEDGHQLDGSVAWSESAETVLQRVELAEFVRHAIDQLPELYRVVLLLRDIEELSTEESAKLLGVTPNAVKIRLHRARQALRTLLDPHMRSHAT